jgi:hypothetical protein
MTTYPPKEICEGWCAKCGDTTYVLLHVTSGTYLVNGQPTIQKKAVYRCQSCFRTMEIVIYSKPTAIYD